MREREREREREGKTLLLPPRICLFPELVVGVDSIRNAERETSAKSFRRERERENKDSSGGVGEGGRKNQRNRMGKRWSKTERKTWKSRIVSVL